MTKLLVKLFVKNSENTSDPSVRGAYGALSGFVGITTNILLSALKLVLGLLSGSLAIMADALNNLSDAGASVITLVSFRMSAKPADREHPFGHARIEYVSSLIVSFLILLIGYELFSSSLDKILHPTETVFHIASVIVLALSIVCKLWLGLFNRTLGKKIDSGVLRATGADSLSDALSTTAVLIALLIFKFTSFDTDGYMGIIVSVIIFIAGIRILNETKNSILGEAPSEDTVEIIAQTVADYPDVLGTHDMMIHTYGANVTIASFHVEVDRTGDVMKLHDMIDGIERRLFEEHQILCTVHMDPVVTDDALICEMRARVQAAVSEIDERLTIHDFRFVEGPTHTNLIFDVVVPFEIKTELTVLRREIEARVAAFDGTYYAVINFDRA